MNTSASSRFFLKLVFAAILLLRPCVARGLTLNYDAPVLQSGTDLLSGAVYLFSNVTPGVDARLTLQTFSGGGTLGGVDNAGGYVANFEPTLTGVPSSTPWVDVLFQFLAAGTNNPVILNDVNWTVLDIDGQAGVQEYTELSNFDTYTLDSPTNVGATSLGGGRWRFFNSSHTEIGGISNDPSYAVTVHYNTVSTQSIRIGLTGTSGASITRLFSEGTTAVSFSSPVTSAPEPGSALLIGSAGLAALLRRRKLTRQSVATLRA